MKLVSTLPGQKLNFMAWCDRTVQFIRIYSLGFTEFGCLLTKRYLGSQFRNLFCLSMSSDEIRCCDNERQEMTIFSLFKPTVSSHSAVVFNPDLFQCFSFYTNGTAGRGLRFVLIQFICCNAVSFATCWTEEKCSPLPFRTAHTTYAAAVKTTTHPKTRCRKPYATTQHPMLLMMGVCTRNMSS